jgi:transposase-like protein
MESIHQPGKRYDEEFKRNAVELLESSGRPMAEVAGDLGIPYKTLERWRGKYRTDRIISSPSTPQVTNPAGQPTSRERELERRLAHAERERDILKKALAICSRDPELRNGSS